MSDGFTDLWNKLNEKYPESYSLMTSISNNFEKIFKEMLPKYELGIDAKRVGFFINKDSNGRIRLAPTEESTIFTMAISQAIVELIAENTDAKGNIKRLKFKKDLNRNHPELYEETVNACPKCGKVNDDLDEYCTTPDCGARLD